MRKTAEKHTQKRIGSNQKNECWLCQTQKKYLLRLTLG